MRLLFLQAQKVDFQREIRPVLSDNCFQCHGTDGVAGELKIAGESSSEIVNHMNSFRARNPRSNIMNVHALAYTPAEITLIADYFSQQGH